MFLQLIEHVLARVHSPCLLIVGQQPGHHLGTNLPRVQIIGQDGPHCLLSQPQLLSIILMVNLQSRRISSFTFSMLASVLDVDERPNLGSLPTSSRPVLNRLRHSNTCVLEMTCSP